MSVALTEAWTSSPGRSSQRVERGGGDLGGQREYSVDPDPDPVAEPVDVADDAGPELRALEPTGASR